MSAIETLRDKADLFVRTGFTDEDGVYHDGPHRIEFDEALAALEALLQAAERTAVVAAWYLDNGRGDLDGCVDALATAVLRVKGDA